MTRGFANSTRNALVKNSNARIEEMMSALVPKKIKKVLLMYPPGKVLRGRFNHCQIPMGLAYLAAVLRDDFEVKIFDTRTKRQRVSGPSGRWDYYGYSWEEIEAHMRAFAPDVVGVSCLFSFVFPEVQRICELAKTIDPGCITVIGGSHPTFLPELTFQRSAAINFIILSEGEQSLPRLLKHIDSGSDYTALDGLAFRRNGDCVVNPKTTFIDDLDTVPFPAFDLLPLDFYEKNAVPFSVTFRNKKNMPILTSRGCTAQCVFCASRNYWGKRFRPRSAENVLDEIEKRVKEYGIKEVQFIDDNLTFDKQRAVRIFQGIIDRKLNISWNTPNGVAVWTLNRPMLELMRKSGCYELTIAFESGDQQVLDTLIKKPLNLQKAAELVPVMKDLGIQVQAFFISGFPGETKKQVLQTFKFAEEMDLDGAWFFMANPTPGSDLYAMSLEKGYIAKDHSFDDINYNVPQFDTEHLSSCQIETMVLKQFNVFLMRCFLRHPFKFFRKYLSLFLAHPVKAFQTTIIDVVRLLKKDDT